MHSWNTLARSSFLGGVTAVTLFISSFISSSLPAQASSSATLGGTAVTGVMVQNMGGQQANNIQLVVDPQNGGTRRTLTHTNVPAESSTTFYIPNEQGLSTPFNAVGGPLPSGDYAGSLYADQPVSYITRFQWTDNGRAGGAMYGGAHAAQSITLPYLAGPTGGSPGGYGNQQRSEFTIQNASTNYAADVVTVNLFPQNSATPTRTVQFRLAPGGSRTLQMGQGDLAGLPDNGIGGFLGWAKISSSNPVAPLAVQSFVDISTSNKAVSAFNRVPTSAAATTLYAPLLRRDFYGTTGVSLVNTTGVSANVTVSYYDDPGSPSKIGSVAQQTLTIPANSMYVLYNGNGPGGPLPDPDQTINWTNNNGWYGSAKITSSQPLVAVVNDTLITQNYTVVTAGIYNTQSFNDARAKVFAPLIRRRHDYTLLSTGVQVQNASGGAANIGITYKDQNGGFLAYDIVYNVQPGASINFYQDGNMKTANYPPMNAGTYGSAMITSTQPVVVLVNESSGNNTMDSANYTGVK